MALLCGVVMAAVASPYYYYHYECPSNTTYYPVGVCAPDYWLGAYTSDGLGRCLLYCPDPGVIQEGYDKDGKLFVNCVR